MLKITSNAVSGYSRILKRLTAAGLSRVLDHMWKGPFGIISAALVKDKEERRVSDEENYRRNGELKNVLKQQGRGFIDFAGGYMYEEEDAPDFPVKEASVFLPGISETDLKALAVQFDQESYIYGERGHWVLRETVGGATWDEGLIEETFESLINKEVGEDYPFMSQTRGDRGSQFRLDSDLVQRRKREQEQLLRDKRRVASGKSPCFYSIAGQFRPRPPVCLSSSGIRLNGNCPDGSLLECWLPLQ